MGDETIFPVPLSVLTEFGPSLVLLAGKTPEEAKRLVQIAWTANMAAQKAIANASELVPDCDRQFVIGTAFSFLHRAATSLLTALATGDVESFVKPAPQVNPGSQFK